MTAMEDLLQRLVRIETKLDMAIVDQRDHEGRLRTLERWKYALPASAATALISAAVAAYAAFRG